MQTLLIGQQESRLYLKIPQSVNSPWRKFISKITLAVWPNFKFTKPDALRRKPGLPCDVPGVVKQTKTLRYETCQRSIRRNGVAKCLQRVCEAGRYLTRTLWPRAWVLAVDVNWLKINKGSPLVNLVVLKKFWEKVSVFFRTLKKGAFLWSYIANENSLALNKNNFKGRMERTWELNEKNHFKKASSFIDKWSKMCRTVTLFLVTMP